MRVTYPFKRIGDRILHLLSGGGNAVVEPTTQTSADFRLAYCGDALDENTMDVRDLAPALIAFGELFDRANLLLNGKDFNVSLKIKATKPGSFELLLILAQVGYTTTQFLSSDIITSAANLVGLITGIPKVGESLFGTFKKLHGQKPEEIQQDDGIVFKVEKLEFRVSNEVARLFKDDIVKQLAPAIVAPLLHTGIDKMVVKDDQKELESVSKEDAPSFNISNIGSDENNDESESVFSGLRLKVVSPTFDVKKSKWRLDDGSGIKWYGIQDDNFLTEVREHKQVFGMDDYLVCNVKIAQHVTDSGLEMERTILSVVKHIKGGEQPRLKLN